MDATDWVEKDWFAHPSRGPFIPVDVGAQACRDELWRLVEAYTKAQSSKSAAASSAANQLPSAYKLHNCP
jgi:hypothetical protein